MTGALTGLLALLAALACGPAGAGTNVGVQSKRVSLSVPDLAIVRATACSPHGVATETVGTAQRWTYGGKFTPVLEVAVRCAPHTTVNGLPSHYNVECKRDDDGRERSKSAWQCLGWEQISVPTTIGDIAIEPGPYSHERATQTEKAALASTRFQYEVHVALPRGCRLASNWSGQADEENGTTHD